jgi:hypothetical protein
MEGLSPIVAYFPRDDSRGEIAIRIIFFLVILSTSAFFFYNQHYLIDLYELAKYCFDSILNWGNNKITDMHVIYINIE